MEYDIYTMYSHKYVYPGKIARLLLGLKASEFQCELHFKASGGSQFCKFGFLLKDCSSQKAILAPPETKFAAIFGRKRTSNGLTTETMNIIIYES